LPSGKSARSSALQITHVFDLAGGLPAGPPLDTRGLILDADFSPDGRQVAVAVSMATPGERGARPGQQGGELQLWDWKAGKQQTSPLVLASEPRSLDFRPDGRQLAALGAHGEVVVIDPGTGQALRRWQAHPPHLENNHYTNNGRLCFTPDGQFLVTYGTATNSARIWNAESGQMFRELKHQNKCHGVQFSSDGRLVSTASFDNRVCIWELSSGKLLATLEHPDWVYTAPFSPDGKQVLTACRDGMARLWNWKSGQLVCPQFKHDHEVHPVAFLSDGRHLVTASDDSVLRFWEWRTGKPVSPPLPTNGAALNFAQNSQGRLLVGGFLSRLHGLDAAAWLSPPQLSIDDLCLWGEVVAGQRIETGGGLISLTADEWLTRWSDFRKRHPEWAVRPD
jgi:WD40 repeat protein